MVIRLAGQVCAAAGAAISAASSPVARAGYAASAVASRPRMKSDAFSAIISVVA
jgi:hypothetical protein